MVKLYNRENVINRLIIRASTNTAAKQDILLDIVQSVEDFISMKTFLEVEDFPTTLESIAVQMGLELFNQMKSEGYQNETIEGITIRYQNIFQKYEVPLRRYRKLRTI